MKKTIAIALALAFAASVSVVFAEELAVKPSDVKEAIAQRKANWEQWKTDRQQKLENLKQEKATWRATFKEKLAKDKCARIEARIQERTAKFGTAKVKHMSAYNNLRNRVQKFITRFDAFYTANSGKVNPDLLTKLKNDFGSSTNSADLHPATLNSLINAFQESLTDFSGKLSSTKKLTCTTTEGELKGSLSDARVYLQTVHTNATAIRTYVRKVILPDLLAVKKDIAKARGGTEDTEEDAKEEEEEGDENGETGTTDTTKPTVSITSPSDTIYTVAGTATISVTAADNIGVTKVEFYDGSSLKETDTASPYSYDWAFAIANNGSHPWTAKAYDAADNTEVSTEVNLTVTIPIPVPTP